MIDFTGRYSAPIPKTNVARSRPYKSDVSTLPVSSDEKVRKNPRSAFGTGLQERDEFLNTSFSDLKSDQEGWNPNY